MQMQNTRTSSPFSFVVIGLSITCCTEFHNSFSSVNIRFIVRMMRYKLYLLISSLVVKLVIRYNSRNLVPSEKLFRSIRITVPHQQDVYKTSKFTRIMGRQLFFKTQQIQTNTDAITASSHCQRPTALCYLMWPLLLLIDFHVCIVDCIVLCCTVLYCRLDLN